MPVLLTLKNAMWKGVIVSVLLCLLLIACRNQSYSNSIGMEFVKIPAGSFDMGSEDGTEREKPVHKVSISEPFYLGRYEVSQAQWEAVMGDNPSFFRGPDHPVEKVSWEDVQEFIRRLNQKEGHQRYRLPTEAEWEYSARAGSATALNFNGDVTELDRYAWHKANSRNSTHPVGKKKPNAWGLYDMYGNVLEWVQDWDGAGSYRSGRLADWAVQREGDDYYRDSPAVDPRGPSSGSLRMNRGGSWNDPVENSRPTARYSAAPVVRNFTLGFRLAMALEKAPESMPPPSSPSKPQQKVITNSLGMEFVEIPASMVSSGPNDPASAIDRPFFMGRYEVTQAQWETVMGGNPSHFKGPDNPVENVSWYDAQDFARRLNELEGHKRYRLPTEAEWEYAAKAGSTTAYSFGEYSRELGRHAWYSDNAEGRTHPVGQKEPNPWGLYDVHGNVEEWVQDWWWPYHDAHLDMIEAAENLSKADLRTDFQIIRGCSWESPAPYCTTKVSSESLPENRNPMTGLRLVMSVE